MHGRNILDVYLSLQMCPCMCVGIDPISYQIKAKKSKYWDRDRLNDIDIMFYKDNTSKLQPTSVIINTTLIKII